MAKRTTFRAQHVLAPGTSVPLNDKPTDSKGLRVERDKAEKEFKSFRDEIFETQRRLYAENRRSLLIVLQAMDAGGKDGTIRHVFRGVNPQGVQVSSFKVPSKEELSHDFLWRIHKMTPAKGMIGVFNRSHYEDVLVVRVDNIVPEDVWRPRFEHINHFEHMLADSGTTILKFYLHISQEEQHKRFHERLKRPEKYWKFSPDDLAKSKKWDEYMVAFNEMLTRCTTVPAPWYIIPADQKWYRNLAVAGVIVETLREMDPQFPQAEEQVQDEDID